jgi:hypothetical protein
MGKQLVNFITFGCESSAPFGLFVIYKAGHEPNKTDRHDITEILLKVVLYTITLALTLELNSIKFLKINIIKIVLRSVLLVKETEIPRQNHQPAASH